MSEEQAPKPPRVHSMREYNAQLSEQEQLEIELAGFPLEVMQLIYNAQQGESRAQERLDLLHRFFHELGYELTIRDSETGQVVSPAPKRVHPDQPLTGEEFLEELGFDRAKQQELREKARDALREHGQHPPSSR